MPSPEKLIILGVFAVVWALFGRTFSIWLQCRTTGVPLSFWALLTMRRSRAQRRELVTSLIACRQAKSNVRPEALMAVQDCGSDLSETARAYIGALRADSSVRFDEFVRNRAVQSIESNPVTESSE